MVNYYKVLKIKENSNFSEIKKAYRILALKYHPDKNKSLNAHDLFIKIHVAYETLIDPNKRRIYDIELQKYRQSKISNTNQIFNNNYKKQKEKAERYAKMSYKEFVKSIDSFLIIAKKAKKTTEKGCAWLAAIILFPIGSIGLINNLFFEQKGGIFIFISIFLMFLGYGAYAIASDE